MSEKTWKKEFSRSAVLGSLAMPPLWSWTWKRFLQMSGDFAKFIKTVQRLPLPKGSKPEISGTRTVHAWYMLGAWDWYCGCWNLMTFRLGETNIDTGANFDITKKHSYISQNSSNFSSHLPSFVIICCFDYRLAPRPLVESNWGRSRFLRQLCLQAKNY